MWGRSKTLICAICAVATVACLPPSGGGSKTFEDAGIAPLQGDLDAGTKFDAGADLDAAEPLPAGDMGGRLTDFGRPQMMDLAVAPPSRDAIPPAPIADAGRAPAPDVCNGLDDDSDGRIDEDFPEFGQDCEAMLDGCLAGALLTCVDGRIECVGED